MIIRVEDQTNDLRTIDLRVPDKALQEVKERGQARYRVSRGTYRKVGEFAYRAAIRTEDGPIRVMVEQDGPIDFYVLLAL